MNNEKPPAVVRWPSTAVKNDVFRLHTSILLNKPKKVIKYVKRGTPVDAYNNDCQPPIFCAALLGKAKVVKTLLKLGANPNARCYPEGYTPLHGACYVGCTKSVKFLLQAGGDLRLTDSQRRTPLDWTILQQDEIKRRNIKDVLDGARMCAFKTSGRELLPELNCRIGTHDHETVAIGTRILRSCCAGYSKDLDPSITSEVILNHNIIPFGYGKVYFGSNERCGAVVGLPFLNDISDLKLDEQTTAASWLCGKFSTFVPMVWANKKTSVSVRELRKSSVEDAIPDILIAELDSLVKLRHPSILLLLAVCHVDNYDSLSLVFEKIPLGSLYFLLYNQFKRLSSRLVMEVITHICEALEYVHASGYLHGFVNSHSIFLVDSSRAKLGCFEYATPIGASKEVVQSSAHPSLRSDNHLAFYRHWAAPELISGKRPLTASSDIYSLCCVMWEIIYGEVPWKDQSLEALRSMMTENPYARIPLDKGVVPPLWYHVLNMGLEPEVPLRDLDLSEVRDMMALSKSRIDVGAGDNDGLNSRVSSSRISVKSFGDPVVESHDAVDAEKLYQLSLYGPHTAV
ncbi:unnamed protein product [Orchesella dallaii]|uniref:Protein kinase domain-containing protein n=1 Tax=Orchesella dallaii TaxID=48710 RepID=A0ABP1RN72_9HEXA